MMTNEDKLYPNCDSSIWLRSCEEEVTEPLEGDVTGGDKIVKCLTFVLPLGEEGYFLFAEL